MRELLLQALIFWPVVVLASPTTVTPAAWCSLYAVSAVGLRASTHWSRTAAMPARAWAWTAAQSVLLAAWLGGASHGLDALHGVHRNLDRVSAQLGGMELWFVLCPGVFSLALARAVARRP